MSNNLSPITTEPDGALPSYSVPLRPQLPPEQDTKTAGEPFLRSNVTGQNVKDTFSFITVWQTGSKPLPHHLEHTLLTPPCHSSTADSSKYQYGSRTLMKVGGGS